ncbi:haloacid dehalogenase [Marinithermofilum abyssi]|uniref:Haloacid dehalogenase n=1 Tax=Marinithermofilum abyssi TaxID=1571185 RepID=A0A8J2VEQ3_9BACL|nr:Cof-type HAD-IIB family hydrolase [Marinithermofilum abyssi]GGE26101.1 haloacid dehalogenase [Marinithermofilum abyssi]
MSHLPYRLLVSDIDGTLVTAMKEIPEINREHINRFRKAGGWFTLATGRSYREAQRFIQQLRVDLPVILCNGALIFEPDSQQVTPVAHLERDVVLSALQEIQRTAPSVDTFVYTANTVYATRIGPLAQAGLDSAEFHLEMISSFSQLPPVPLIKLVAVADETAMKELHQWGNTTTYPVEFVQSSAHYFEVMPKNVSKGAALQTLAERLDLELEQTAAIGDHLNDLRMIQQAGISAAVANAHPQLMQAADVITVSNEEGAVGHFIQEHLLHIPSRSAHTS